MHMARLPLTFGVTLAGNKVESYGGTISFTLGHSEYNSLGLGAQEEYDIILESKTLGISLGHKHIVPGNLPVLAVLFFFASALRAA